MDYIRAATCTDEAFRSMWPSLSVKIRSLSRLPLLLCWNSWTILSHRRTWNASLRMTKRRKGVSWRPIFTLEGKFSLCRLYASNGKHPGFVLGAFCCFLSLGRCPLMPGEIVGQVETKRRQGVSRHGRHYCKHWMHPFSTGPGYHDVDTFLYLTVSSCY